MTPAASVGAEVRRLRQRARLSQEALAERAGLGLSTLKALERNSRQRPRASTLARIADALQLAPAERSAFLELGAAETPQPKPAEVPQLSANHSHRPQLSRLPLASTALIGRDAELADARSLLDP